jgi:NAD(P)H-nitrite reductase large subunit
MRHVIIGASAAGLSAAQTIRSLRPQDEIIVVSPEDRIFSRCLLHHLIGGQRSIDNMSFVAPDFFEKNQIQWLKGIRVQTLDAAAKKVFLADGDWLDYDKLLIATGAQPSMPPIPNLQTANNIFTLRELADAIAISGQAKAGESAVVIGGGLIGVDAAVGLAEKGMQVNVIEMADRILPLQLDKISAAKYENLFEQHGITIYTGNSVREVIVNDNNDVIGVILANGQTVTASLIVVAAGIRPNTAWISDPLIKVGKGIVIDDRCRATADSVFAAGDVTGLAGIWPLAVKHGNTAAYNMCDQERTLDDIFNLKNSLNFFGLKTVSLGISEAPDDSYEVEVYESSAGYKKLIHRNGLVYGAIFQGDLSNSGVWSQIIGNKRDISRISGKDIFDIDYSDFFKINAEGQFYY